MDPCVTMDQNCPAAFVIVIRNMFEPEERGIRPWSNLINREPIIRICGKTIRNINDRCEYGICYIRHAAFKITNHNLVLRRLSGNSSRHVTISFAHIFNLKVFPNAPETYIGHVKAVTIDSLHMWMVYTFLILEHNHQPKRIILAAIPAIFPLPIHR